MLAFDYCMQHGIYKGYTDIQDAPNKDYNDLKDDLETRLSELIRKNPELTYKALGEALSVSAATIKRTLTKMQHEGKVIREGSNRKGKWTLIS